MAECLGPRGVGATTALIFLKLVRTVIAVFRLELFGLVIFVVVLVDNLRVLDYRGAFLRDISMDNRYGSAQRSAEVNSASGCFLHGCGMYVGQR